MYYHKIFMNNINNNRSRAARERGFMARCAVLLAVLGAVATVLSTPVHAQSFSGLGFLTGGNASYAMGVNADGTVVVGNSNAINAAGNILEAFRWTQAGGMAGLGFLTGGNASYAMGVNADGTVVVGNSNAINAAGNILEAFRWTRAGGMVGLGFLPVVLSGSDALGVNADGTVVVGLSRTSCACEEAFRWTQAGGMVSLGGPGSQAFAVNADGTVVVGIGSIPRPSPTPLRRPAGPRPAAWLTLASCPAEMSARPGA